MIPIGPPRRDVSKAEPVRIYNQKKTILTGQNLSILTLAKQDEIAKNIESELNETLCILTVADPNFSPSIDTDKKEAEMSMRLVTTKQFES